MQVNPAMLVGVLGIGRGVGVGEAQAFGIGNKDVGIVARVVTLAPVGCWSVGLLKIRCCRCPLASDDHQTRLQVQERSCH